MNILGELKIIKDHWYFRLIKRARPLTIHTECLHKDNVWERTKGFVNSGKFAIWYVVTPVNFDFVRAQSGCDMNRKEWERLMLKRYKWLKEHGQEIQAHVHLRIKMSLYSSREEARKDAEYKISGAVKWLRDNGFNPDKIVFGWWSYNQDAIEIAKKYGLKLTERLNYYFIHDYDLVSGRY